MEKSTSGYAKSGSQCVKEAFTHLSNEHEAQVFWVLPQSHAVIITSDEEPYNTSLTAAKIKAMVTRGEAYPMSKSELMRAGGSNYY
jgi:hypothetical protein